MIAILMGVTASGKSTIAAELVKLTGWEFAEGDDYHSEANKQKMHSGIPLTDEDRAPWLASLHEVIAGWVHNGKSGVMTCSALKQSYRDVLTAGIPKKAYRFVLLDVPLDVLRARIKDRPSHFMNPDLLQSQLDTLELPQDALRVEECGEPRDIAKNILSQLAPAYIS
ncbi:MAG TPA: gluconokinase [Acidobacteriaceae bacterium]|nr:gluconokinase [Acidobacteriaceae bacterium]